MSEPVDPPEDTSPAIALPSLTDAELHDVAVVTTAANEIAAIPVLDCLDDAGIPAMKQTGLVYFGSSGAVEIRVPRKLLAIAKEVLEQSRVQAQERGVNLAFKAGEQEPDEEAITNDPILADMLLIANEPKESRPGELAPFLADWLADGKSLPEIAQYLAVAGLDRSEAERLIDSVKTEQSDLLIDSLKRRANRGITLVIAGVGLFIAPFFGAVFPFLTVIAVCVFVAGLGIVALSYSEISKLNKAKR